MTGVTFRVEPVDDRRLPDGQAAWVEALLSQYVLLLETLSGDELALYRHTWKQMARHNAPVVARSLLQPGQTVHRVQQIIIHLNACKLLWFDDDLRAILQCPPFSVLHTAHEVKAFGWDRSYTCSFLDMPLTLLIYGPNVWLTCASKCPRSGETLSFRVRMTEDFRLEADTPFQDWRVWLPLPDTPATDAYPDFYRLRPRINAFYSPADLDTHRQYHTGDAGVVYTLPQSLYLSECLLGVYRFAAI
ncbi:MAG: hypothetical protein HZC41_19690 [Chloroflexi bacterium]|nr:hypothetical protein [Chloroflexota bacterium]